MVGCQVNGLDRPWVEAASQVERWSLWPDLDTRPTVLPCPLLEVTVTSLLSWPARLPTTRERQRERERHAQLFSTSLFVKSWCLVERVSYICDCTTPSNAEMQKSDVHWHIYGQSFVGQSWFYILQLFNVNTPKQFNVEHHVKHLALLLLVQLNILAHSHFPVGMWLCQSKGEGENEQTLYRGDSLAWLTVETYLRRTISSRSNCELE